MTRPPVRASSARVSSTRAPRVRASVLWSIGVLLVFWLALLGGALLRRPLLGLIVGAVAASFFVWGWARSRWRERRLQRTR